MAGWYELSKNESQKYSFVLKAGNSEVILRSQSYESKAGAENGISSVRTNGVLDERFERQTASDGRPYFNLKAGNGQIIGTSQMYKTESGRDGGIESVKTNCVCEKVKEVEPE